MSEYVSRVTARDGAERKADTGGAVRGATVRGAIGGEGPVGVSVAAARSPRVAADMVALLDAGIIVAGALFATAILAPVAAEGTKWATVAQCGLISAALFHWFQRAEGRYTLERLERGQIDGTALLAALLLALFAVIGLGSPFPLNDGRIGAWYAIWVAASFPALLAVRYTAREQLGRLTRVGAFDTRVAIYGGGRIAERLAEHVGESGNGVALVGVYDDRVGGDRPPLGGPPVNGSLADLVEAGRREEIDQIIIALPPAADARTTEIARKLEQLPVSLHVCAYLVSDLVEEGSAHRVSTLGPLGLIDVKRKPLADWAPIVKALEDRVLGALLLLALSPVMLACAVAIKLDSKGPVLFRQRRRGLNQRIIEVRKFRTMRVMEDGAEVRQATRNDPRVTRVGAFMRRTSLDELPQLLNVLEGSMSLVGPRPHALVHDEQWGELLERYANRHQVKPGMTGWAQINGYRGEVESTEAMGQRVEHDLDYINNWSLGRDLHILARTLRVALGDKKAY